MQCKNGGWASFDKDNDRMVFQYIPFADHNAMLDPATVDITGRILEMLATYGYDKNHPAVKKAIEFHPQGAGAGWQLVRALGRELHLRHGAGVARTGGDWRGHHEPCVQQAAEWLRMVQNPDGGWGETVRLLRRSHIAKGRATARLRRPRGRSWDCWRPTTRAAIRWRAASRICCARRRKMARGMSRSSPAPDFPRVFLPDVSHVPAILPAARADNIRQDDGEEQSSRVGPEDASSLGRMRPGRHVSWQLTCRRDLLGRVLNACFRHRRDRIFGLSRCARSCGPRSRLAAAGSSNQRPTQPGRSESGDRLRGFA